MSETTQSRPSDDIAAERLAASGKAVADLAHLAKNIIQVLSGCGEIIDLALATRQFDRVEKAWTLFQPSFWRLKKFQLDLIKYTKEYPMNPQACRIEDILAAAAKPLTLFFEKRGVTYTCRPADGLCAITADDQKLQEAVTNLLIAAVDNLQDQPGQVRLNASVVDSGRAVCIRVCDSGPLLDSAACRALLTPHERCRNMLGTGLEIPLAKQIAEQHNGHLTVYSDSVQGNTLAITLPLKN